MMSKNNEIVSIEGWGIGPDAPEVARFLAGPQRRVEELRRALRIFFEFVRGFRAFHFAGPCVTVFGSARFGENYQYYQLAREMGAELARAGFTVMTGGGPGIMEAANRGAKEAAGAPSAAISGWHGSSRPIATSISGLLFATSSCARSCW